MGNGRTTGAVMAPPTPLSFAHPALNVAYSATCTYQDAARAEYITHLSGRSQAGARARCWRCDRPTVALVTLPAPHEPPTAVAVAICEACEAWCVM